MAVTLAENTLRNDEDQRVQARLKNVIFLSLFKVRVFKIEGKALKLTLPQVLKQTLLNDGLIGIRRFRPDDVPLLLDAVHESVNELCTFMTWCRRDYSLADSRTFIARCDSDWEKGERYNFAIVDPTDKILVGSVGLNRIDRAHNFAHIGYWVRRTRTGHGVATSATRLVASFGLKELGFHRLEILVPGNNAASQRVAQKAGAKFEGTLRKRLVLSDGLHDAFLYSLVPADLALPVSRSMATTAASPA